MESSFMTAVSTVGLSSHAQAGVSLLPVRGGYDGTRVSSANPIGALSGTRTRMDAPIATTTKNAGLAGTPGYPSWSHPV